MKNPVLFAILAAACSPAVSGGDNGPGGDGGAGGGGLVVTPDTATVTVTAGGGSVTQIFKASAGGPGGQDVSDMSSWSLDDPTLGAMDGKTFVASGMHGGATTVRASYTARGGATLTGSAQIVVVFNAGVTCPGCPSFPPDGAPACSGAAPSLVYPPDGVLLPPNMNVIEIHFLPGAGNTLFEIDFRNHSTDVRIETKCDAVTNTRGKPTGGCAFKLDPTAWGYVAGSNRGGEPVQVTVRGAPAGLSCVAPSNQVALSFSQEDVNGGIYYWQSVTQNGVAGKTGGIFREDFGDPSKPAEAFLTPGTTNKCVGCHFLSRDGTRMTYGSDDADSDDEYGDLDAILFDVASRRPLGGNIKLPAGFQTFSPDHKDVLASDGEVTQLQPPLFRRYNGDTSAHLTDVKMASLNSKAVTQPDWSKDGATIFFVVPGQILAWQGTSNDDHFAGGSIYKMGVSAGVFAAPQPLVSAANANENNYYPAVSPDGQYLVFNRATGTGIAGRDSFNNPGAALMGLFLNGGSPVELAKAGRGHGLTNSWPRWSPFVQSYQGRQLLWVTFSSTRDYGLRVQNENVPSAAGGPLVNCYPPDSPENPDGNHGDPFPANCNQPQIWMAAVSLSELSAGHDPSYPAFWLPFQDLTAHNHIAQWTEKVVGPPTGGCAMENESCASKACCAGLACDAQTNTCLRIIP